MPAGKRRRRQEPPSSEPRPAPGDLALIQQLVNTASAGEAPDSLATPPALCRWLIKRRLLDADHELDAAQHRRGLDARAGFRALILDAGGAATGAGALRRLEKATAAARFAVRFDDAGRPIGYQAASAGFDGALGALVAIAVAARLEGSWPRFKLCARGECRRAFFDTSPRRNGRWCTPQCGYRVRAAAYRRSDKYYRPR